MLMATSHSLICQRKALQAAHRVKGLPAAVCIDGGMGCLGVLGVALMEVQHCQQLLPSLPVHYLAQAICALGEPLAALCDHNTNPNITMRIKF